MIIREIAENEIDKALQLVWTVFLEYEAPDYTKEGIEEFKRSIHDPEYLSKLDLYGAFDRKELIGIIATRNQGNHIALFFVKGNRQGQKVGRALFLEVYKRNKSGELTVNSSPYATKIYHHLGFVDTDKEKVVNGLKFTPMVYQFKSQRLETTRLILRPWTVDDAEVLYQYASDPEVGPIAGWPVHTSVENSRDIIKNVLGINETYAVVLKDKNQVVGSIGLMIGNSSNIDILGNEAEVGYWIGKPYWGQGLIPEAVREILRHAFTDLGIKKMWCGYFDGNIKSKRVQEKCGFTFHHIEKDKPWPLMNDIRTEVITCLPKEIWRNGEAKEKDCI